MIDTSRRSIVRLNFTTPKEFHNMSREFPGKHFFLRLQLYRIPTVQFSRTTQLPQQHEFHYATLKKDRNRDRDTDAFPCVSIRHCHVAQLSTYGLQTGYTTDANNCIIRWRVIDNDRRVSDRIPRANSAGFYHCQAITLSGLLAGRLENRHTW